MVSIRKFKMLYFRNERCHGTGNLKGIFPGHLPPPLHKNSEVSVISEFDDVTMNHLFLEKKLNERVVSPCLITRDVVADDSLDVSLFLAFFIYF